MDGPSRSRVYVVSYVGVKRIVLGVVDLLCKETMLFLAVLYKRS